MKPYIHTVQYYETDCMGITHHSNYIRWMEEARMDYLGSLGFGMRRLEAEGVTSPVVSVDCRYRHPTVFDDEVRIGLRLSAYTGARLSLSYRMTLPDGTEVCTAGSEHCFIDAAGRPVSLKKRFPAFDAVLRAELEAGEGAEQ